jgi:glycosyltransferase involved in cell wall biosynthesis
MRILVLNHEFPPVGGGGGRAAEGICQILAKRGHEIKVLTSHIKGLSDKEYRDGFQIIRIRTLRTQAFQASLLSMATYVLAGLWHGFRLIRSFQPQVIHVHFAVPAGALAWILSTFTRIPYVLTAHLGDVPGGVPEKTGDWFRWIFPFTRFVWRDASARVAVSEFTRELALQHYNQEILVIPNGVDSAAAKPDSMTLNDPPVLVFAGRFMPQKAPLQVIRILNHMKGAAWKCVMIGDGPLLAEVRQAVVDGGFEDRIAFPGWISPEEVMTWFAKSDILFMPSLSEGLPVVGVQALSKGLAIVASRVGGFVDLVDEDLNGYLFEPGDTAAFAAKLQHLLQDPGHLLSLRKASLEKAKAFEIAHIAGQYELLFRSIVQERSQSVSAKGKK